MNEPEPIHLSIFHTNDMHGHLEAMARLSTFCRRLRVEAQAQGRNVFFWDAGDAADRRVRFCSLTKGAAFSPVLNAMGYSLQTMGNDISLPYGPQAMAAVAARAHFPILAANCRDGAGPLPEGLGESVLIPLSGGLKMGVLGLTAPWDGMYEIFGLHLPDFCGVARDLVTKLRAQGAAPVIVLSHLGLPDDRRLAEAVSGINVIIGGHSHDYLPSGEEHSSVLITQTGQFAERLGRVDLTLDPRTGHVIARSADVLAVPADEAPDPAVIEAISVAERKVEALIVQPIGTLQSSLDVDYERECGIGNLAADALREHVGADIAMVCSGMFHQGLLEGIVTLGQLDAACFTTANPCLTVVRGSQVLSALERGLDPAICRSTPQGFRGTPVGIPQISGMQVEYDPAGESSRRVRRVTVQGELLESDRLYRLAHTDAETLDDVGYLQLDKGQVTKVEAPIILPEVMQDYIRVHSPVAQPAGGRWLPIQ
jgi:5'-nucleotidase